MSGENPAEAEQPFLVLSDTGRFSRILLARIAIGEDETLRYYALKIQRSTYREYGPGTSQPFPTNSEIDDMWRRERENLSAAAGDHLARVLDLGTDHFRSPPVLFCRKAKHYFHPFCSKCLGTLSTCRDEELLRAWNLPSYGKSSERYLYCADCATGGSAVLYTQVRDAEIRPGEGVEIRTRVDLFRDITAATNEDGRLEKIFPCIGTGCLSAGMDGENHFSSVSFHDFFMLPLEMEQLHYDEWIDLVGGAPWETLRAAIQEKSPDRLPALAELEKTLSRPFQWMNRETNPDLFAVEVMRLKISAFSQVCRGVREIHAKTGSPHLALDPSNVMVSLLPCGPAFPALWNGRARVIDLGSAHQFRPMRGLKEYFGDCLLPSPDIEKSYASPAAQEGSRGQEESMRITIQNVVPAEKGAWVEIDAVSSSARLEDFRVRDIVHVVPTSPISWFEGVDLWGTIVERLEKGCKLSVFAPELTGEPKPPITVDGNVAFTRRLDLPCDVHSLGMLYFRSLLVNDEQDFRKVEDTLTAVIKRLETNLEGANDPSFGLVSDRLHWELDAEADVFNSGRLLFRKTAGDLPEEGVPESIWQEAIVLGFRMISNVPGFSICADHGDHDPENRAALLDGILAEVEKLNTRLQVELFEQEKRNREIAGLCHEMQETITGHKLGEEKEVQE